LVRDLAKTCDGLIEGYRPGVMERLGLGPDPLLADNPRLVYGRMTGWGQEGPLAHAAGHDINYIALSGALHGIGRDGRPSPPVNYLGDFGGGGMLLAFAMASALLAVRNGAPGQVIDCAMTDGSALLTALTRGLHAAGLWEDRAGANVIDGGSPWYDAYETADGQWIAIGAIEPQFRAILLDLIGLSGDEPDLKSAFCATFRQHPRDHWCALLEGSDACFAPVLSLAEAPGHPHNTLRGTFAIIGGVVQPAPAPRYSGTPTDPPRAMGDEADALLAELGYDAERIAALRGSGIIG
jgi:alpha-methylacyl-CoA racemase